MSELHFIRPLWLLLIPVVIAMAWWWRSQRATHGGWSEFVDAHLLTVQYTLDDIHSTRWLRRSVPLAAVVALLAAAGPTWEQEDAQVVRQQSGRVFILDLSQSMNAADIKPSRLVMARLKLVDLLQASRDRQVGLVAFAASPYMVSPLTDDALTLRETAVVLSTDLVPTQGANLAAAIDYAKALLEQSGLPSGELVLITDSAPDDAALAAAQRSAADDVAVSVLAVGTRQGAPVPGKDGRTMRDDKGRPLMAELPTDALKALAVAGSGRFSTLQTNGTDIDTLLTSQGRIAEGLGGGTRSTEQWVDRGPWLLWLLLPWALWVFSARWF